MKIIVLFCLLLAVGGESLQDNAACTESDCLQLQGEERCMGKDSDLCIQMLLEELAKLQTRINASLCLPDIQVAVVAEVVTSINTEVHLFYNALSQLDMSIMNLSKLSVALQMDILMLEQLLATIHNGATLVTDETTLGATYAEATLLYLNLTVFLDTIMETAINNEEVLMELEAIVGTVNVTLVDIYKNQSNDYSARVDSTVAQSLVTLNHSVLLHMEATSGFGKAMRLLECFEGVSQELLDIIQLENQVNVSMVSNLHQDLQKELNELQRLQDCTQSKNTTIVWRTSETCQLLQASLLLLEDIDRILQNSTLVFARIEAELAGYQSYDHELQLHTLMLTVVMQHVMILSEQAEQIHILAESFGLSDMPELDRLAAIQSIAEEAITVSHNVSKKNAVVLEVAGEVHELKNTSQVLLHSMEVLNNTLKGINEVIDVHVERIEDLYAVLEGTINTFGEVTEEINKTFIIENDIQVSLWSLRGELERVSNVTKESNETVERVALGVITQSDREQIVQNIAESESHISSVERQVKQRNTTWAAVANGTAALNDSLLKVYSLLQDVQSMIDDAERTVSETYNFLNLVQLPVKISDTIISKTELQAFDVVSSGELHSVSIFMRPEQTEDSVVVHLVNKVQRNEQSISVIIGILNGSIYASFIQSDTVGGVTAVNLTISELKVTAFRQYRVEASRGERNMHLLVLDVDMGVQYRMSTTTSSAHASHFQFDFLREAELYIGGTSVDTELQDTLFAKAGSYIGCIKYVQINGIVADLWSGSQKLRPCGNTSMQLSAKPLLSLHGMEYSHADVNASIFPLTLRFQTLRPNGLLFFARNDIEASSLWIFLSSGQIVARVGAGESHRTITSLETYSQGSVQNISLTLTESQRHLVLSTDQEVITKGLKSISTEDVLNYSELFVGGLPMHLGDEFDISNFSGCIWASTLAEQIPAAPVCIVGNDESRCPYCSDQAVLSSSFYGESYVAFPSMDIGSYFDVTFSFKTAFRNGLILFAGNTTQAAWIAVSLVNSKLHLIFGSVLGNLGLPARSPSLADNKWHNVIIVTAGPRLELTVDGVDAGNFPFGGFFPTGSLDGHLYIGGISTESLSSLPLGVNSEGFKGCLDQMFIQGRPLDFAANVGLQWVAFNVCYVNCGSLHQDVYSLNGSAFAQYDLGRFATNFSLGLQFRTVHQTALILYVFSRRRDDKIALQTLNGRLQLYGTDGCVEGLATSDVEITDGLWHTATIEKCGERLRLIVDGRAGEEVTGPAEQFRTHTPLYIGGLPDGRIPLPQNFTSENFIGCLRMSFLNQAQLTNVIPNECVVS